MTLLTEQIQQLDGQVTNSGDSTKNNSIDMRQYGMSGQEPVTIDLLKKTMLAQYQMFMKIADNVADMDAGAKKLRERYLRLLQQDYEKHVSLNGGANKSSVLATLSSHGVRNPFEAADRVEAEEERREKEKINRKVQLAAQGNAGPATNTVAPGAAPNGTHGVATGIGGFGSVTNNAAPIASGIGGFGGAASVATTPSATGLFGATNTAASAAKPAAPAAGFGGFGSTTTSTAGTGTNTSGGFSFGAASTAPAAATPAPAAAGSSLFSNPSSGGFGSFGTSSTSSTSKSKSKNRRRR